MRRSRIFFGRARRTFPGQGLRQRCVFFHFPKCGGTSIAEAMYAAVPFSERLGVIDAKSTRRAAAVMSFEKDDPFLCHEDLPNGQRVFDLREALLLQHMAWDTRLIHGHVLFSERAMRSFGDRYRLVTVMRDPIDRTISNYRMALRTGVFSGGPDDYLQSEVARSHSQVYLRYLCGTNRIGDDEIDTAIEVSKKRLARFALVGFLDDLSSFRRRFREQFGVSLNVRHLNEAPGARPGFGRRQLERLAELCAHDLEIYDFARHLQGNANPSAAGSRHPATKVSDHGRWTEAHGLQG